MIQTQTVVFSSRLQELLAPRHLLKHPFYQDWTEGKLLKKDLRNYAEQYFQHVDAFPRYLSATHSHCADLAARQVLLDNLMDEERGSENHPELWLRFAEGLGTDRAAVRSAEVRPATQDLVNTFMDLARSSFAEGLGALYAYEQQVPEIAAAKIDGLKRFYDIEDPETLKFFTVHLEADVYHARAASDLLESLTPEGKELAQAAAQKAADALWRFMDGVQQDRALKAGC